MGRDFEGEGVFFSVLFFAGEVPSKARREGRNARRKKGRKEGEKRKQKRKEEDTKERNGKEERKEGRKEGRSKKGSKQDNNERMENPRRKEGMPRQKGIREGRKEGETKEGRKERSTPTPSTLIQVIRIILLLVIVAHYSNYTSRDGEGQKPSAKSLQVSSHQQRQNPYGPSQNP